ncbi:hypothetical protein [Muricoccus aerilatus]|uniref:hypothetical protein n=1 Tax=Muricoccus aerilatus TaxID=452982 RepID=UPI0012EC1D60|nr:hypothetical protein [Roseomonas aerilata]
MMTSKPLINDLRSFGRTGFLMLGQLALFAGPLITLASATQYPFAGEHTNPAISQQHDATVAQTDPPWTWAEKYYFTS